MSTGTSIDRRPGLRERIRTSRYGTAVVLMVTFAVVLVLAHQVQRPADADALNGVTAVELTGTGSGEPPAVGRPAQDFTAVAVDGTQISLADLAGRPVWLTFGASWCATCRAEAPDIQAAHAAQGAEGVRVVAVFLNEDPATVADYADRVGLTFPAVADPRTDIASAYRVLGIPAHFFIDSDGIVRSIVTGAMSAERIDESLEGLS